MYDKDPSKIRYSTKKRDDFGGNSDGFGIILDTFDDNENALLFATTPAGLRSDFMIFNDAVGRYETGESGRVIGIDFSEAMIDKARKNTRKLGYNNVEFLSGEIEHLPVSDNEADVVVSNCV
ncbi:unnamed protein product, partial [marine sediment metagenome]